jgi:hypothetical protein
MDIPGQPEITPQASVLQASIEKLTITAEAKAQLKSPVSVRLEVMPGLQSKEQVCLCPL